MIKTTSLIAIVLTATLIAACGGSDSTPASLAPSVASVTISGGNLTLAPGTTGTLTAQTLDASGNSVDAAVTWHSSDATVAIVSDGTVTAVALGQSQVTAEANGVVSTAQLVVVNPSQSAERAIAAALAAGQITDEQALMYNVLAVFNDPRLPPSYRSTSDQPESSHDLLLYEAANRFATLSAANQDVIGPYLVPPSYATKVPASSRASVKDANPRINLRSDYCSGSLLSTWASKDTPHFRVWYNSSTRPEQAASALAIGGYAETAYAALVGGPGFNAPLPDTAWACDGGDSRTDIYLLEDSFEGGRFAAFTVPLDAVGDGDPSAAFIRIGASALAGDVKAVVAHEFMHAIQFGYKNMGLPSYRWTVEATAEWAIDVVFSSPRDISPLKMIPPFLHNIHMPLFYPNNYCNSTSICTDSASDLKMYGAYAFFQFLTVQAGQNAVSQFFSYAALSDNPLTGINFVLTGQGGLTKVWPQFVLSLWNQDPVPKEQRFSDWDGEAAWALDNVSTTELVTGDKLPAKYQAPARFMDGASTSVKLNELSAIYNQYDFYKDVHSVVVYNGFSSRLTTLDAVIDEHVTVDTTKTLDGGKTLATFKATDDQLKGRHIWALKKINDAWMPPEDWTSVGTQPICLDEAGQRIQSLILIFSNGNFTTSRGDNMEDNALDSLGDQKTTLIASKTPCWKYKGTTKATLAYDDGTDKFTVTTGTTATFIGQPAFAEANVSSGHVTAFRGWTFVADPTTVAFNASVQGTLNSCYLNDNLNLSISQGVDFFGAPPSFYSWVYPEGTDGYNTYSGIGNNSIQFVAPGCTGGKTKTLPAVNPINFNLGFNSFEHVDLANGKLDSGAAGLSSQVWQPGDYDNPGTVTNNWCLMSLRENPESPATPGCP